MATNIRLKRSAVQGNAPSTAQLDLGELAINTYDGDLYLKRTQGANTEIRKVQGISTSETLITNASSVGELIDVNIAGISNGQSIRYITAASEFQAFDPVQNLDDLLDVTITSPSNGQSLVYNSANSTWIADSIGTNGTGITRDQFTGTGSQTQYTLTTAPNESEVIVFVGSVFQDADTFSISGNTLTFSTAPAASEIIEVFTIGNASLFNTIEDSFTGTGSQTDYTLTYAISQTQALVTVNGIVQQPGTHYTITDTTLSFAGAPTSGAIIDVRYAIYGTTVAWSSISNKPDPTITLTGDATGNVTLTDLQSANLVVDISSITGDVSVSGNVTAAYIDSSLDGNIILGVRNDSGSTIAAGTPVYISGFLGASGKVTVSPADAANSDHMPAIGLTTTALVDGAEGYAVPFGVVPNINTAAFAVGDTVYVASGGGLTSTRPSAPNLLVQNVGKVEKVNSSSGQILVLGPGRTNDVSNEITITGDLESNNVTAVQNVSANIVAGNTLEGNLNWSYITNKPDPTVTVTLSGDVTGNASATLTDLANGTISISTTVAGNSVALGTDTTGSYVANVVAGTGVLISNTAGGESEVPVIAIGQNVNTTANVTFNDVTVSGNLVISGDISQIDAATLVIEDPIIKVGNGQSTPVYDLGFLGQRYTSANSTNYNVAVVWDESADEFIVATTSSDASATSITVDGYADFHAKDITANNVTATSNVAANGMTIDGNDVATINDVIALAIALG